MKTIQNHHIALANLPDRFGKARVETHSKLCFAFTQESLLREDLQLRVSTDDMCTGLGRYGCNVVVSNWRRSLRYCSAASWLSGSSGFGSVSSEQIDRITFDARRFRIHL